MSFGKRGVPPAGPVGAGFGRRDPRGAGPAPNPPVPDDGEARRLRDMIVVGVAIAITFAVPLAVSAVEPDFPPIDAFGVGAVAMLPVVWLLAILGLVAVDHEHARRTSLDSRFVAAHPLVAGIGGLIGFGWKVSEMEVGLWAVLATSRYLFYMQRNGEPPQYMMEALEGVLYGVGICALIWWMLVRVAGARR